MLLQSAEGPCDATAVGQSQRRSFLGTGWPAKACGAVPTSILPVYMYTCKYISLCVYIYIYMLDSQHTRLIHFVFDSAAAIDS